jgi:hypothetical protein
MQSKIAKIQFPPQLHPVGTATNTVLDIFFEFCDSIYILFFLPLLNVKMIVKLGTHYVETYKTDLVLRKVCTIQIRKTPHMIGSFLTKNENK